MMIWALLGLALVTVAGIAACAAAYRLGGDNRETRLALERAERRAQHRAEARAKAGRHRLQPFPDHEQAERPADTGELAALSQAAETGDLAEIGRQNAAFFRRFDLFYRWARAA